ncbi:MAG: glycosyl transferase family 9 [Acidobacteria bacterium]|nr:glycosyl transferase family 9 [Acidobacteriota bacterium]
MKEGGESVQKVLIYRLGHIGDTVVALPCFRLIAKAFPMAERRLLTNLPHGAKAAPIETVLGPMGLVHGYFKYPLGTRLPQLLYHLARQIREWKPEVLVYLAAPRGRVRALRDALFFKACGIGELVGVPWTADLQKVRGPLTNGVWEHEASRMGRCIARLGEVHLDDPASYDLNLSLSEREKAEEILSGWRARNGFICASIGTKADTKDWGKENWKEFFSRRCIDWPTLGLVLVGSADEYSQSGQVAAGWQGPALNLCGKITPRETAALMEKALLFVGHDSGPMHLAAAVGTICIAIFGARNLPGEWYPFGFRHHIIYHRTQCFGCMRVTCEEYDKICIRSVSVDEVCTSLNRTLSDVLTAKRA